MWTYRIMDTEGADELYSYDVEDFVINMCRARKRQEVFERKGRDLAVLASVKKRRGHDSDDVQELQGHIKGKQEIT